MSEIHWKEECPKCRKLNWMWVGSNDVEAYQCYACNHKWLVEGAEDWIDDIEDAFLCKGQEKIKQ